MIRPKKYRHPPQGTVGVVSPQEDERVLRQVDKTIEATKMLDEIDDPDLHRLSWALEMRDDKDAAALIKTCHNRYGDDWQWLSLVVLMASGRNVTKAKMREAIKRAEAKVRDR